jgi:hypothetical protein
VSVSEPNKVIHGDEPDSSTKLQISTSITNLVHVVSPYIQGHLKNTKNFLEKCLK